MSDSNPMMKRHKLSGAQSRKKKLQIEESINKQKGWLSNYLNKTNTTVPVSVSAQSSASNSETAPAEPLHVEDVLENEMEVDVGVAENENEITTEVSAADSNKSSTEDGLDGDVEAALAEDRFDDPANWPNVIDDATRVALVKKGPVRIKEYDFPKNEDKHNRRFKETYYNRKLKNGEEVERTWLVYSRKNDAVYCFFCKLFSDKKIALTEYGYSDWKNISGHLLSHECSPKHCESVRSWAELGVRLNRGLTIDKQKFMWIHNYTPLCDI